jgi:hypothetical protein
MTDKAGKWWWLPGALFMLTGLGFLLGAIKRGDDTGKWLLAIFFFGFGLSLFGLGLARRRAAPDQGPAPAPTNQGTERTG